MLRPRDNDTRRFRPGHLDNIAAATFLRNSSNTAMIPTVGHSFLDCWVDHDFDHLAWSVGDEKSSEGLLASVPRLPADQGSSFCSEALGTSQQPVLR